jgi:hypothetical protein
VSERDVVPLGRDPEPPETPPPSRPPRLQNLAIAGMTACAAIGTIAALALFTVTLTEPVRRYVSGAVLFAAVGFLACAATAVMSAARNTYARQPERPGSDGGH